MTGFSGKQPGFHSGTLTNQPFWPDMSLERLSVDYRIPNDLEYGTVAEHCRQAMTDINLRLYEYRKTQQEKGYTRLDEVPAETVDDESILLMLYRRAVSFRCKATVCRDYPTIDRREPAENQAKSSEETEGLYLRLADEAVRSFLEMSDITVELL